MSNKPSYKTTRKYKCPYCELKASRGELVDHVDKKHEDLIPEDYNAARAVYDSINGKNYGICMSCKKQVYKWNDKINRYYNLCDSPQCRAKVREIALARHIKVHNKPTLLNDPDQQAKMLANRRISGTYTFSDGKKFTYTGKYERKALEFMDKVLNIPSNDIQTPGPVLEYEYKGKKHKWITDIYYVPANLLIEIKDGGSNPNNRSMESYREKQVAKEVMITDRGNFNYIRLTDNNFAQLLDIFADMKNEALTSDNPEVKIHINEEVGGLPQHRPPEAYIIPYGMNNTFTGFGYSDSELDGVAVIDDENNISYLNESDFFNNYDTAFLLYHINENTGSIISEIHEILSIGKVSNKFEIASKLCGITITKPEDIILSETLKYYDIDYENRVCSLLENGIQIKPIETDSNIVRTDRNVFVHISPNGYYASTPSDFYIASEYFDTLEDLERSGLIDLMNNIYASNSQTKGAIIDE